MIDYFNNLYDNVFEYAYESLTDDIIWNGYYVESAPDGGGVILTEAKKSNTNIRKPVKKKKMSRTDIFRYARYATYAIALLLLLIKLIKKKKPGKDVINTDNKSTGNNGNNEVNWSKKYDKEIAVCDKYIEYLREENKKIQENLAKCKKKNKISQSKKNTKNNNKEISQAEEYKQLLKSGEDVKKYGLEIINMARRMNIEAPERLVNAMNQL